MTEWERSKSAMLQKDDKSIKGSIDAPFLPLFEVVNNSLDAATTSCCSGRVTLFGESVGNRKKGGKMTYVSHDIVNDYKVVFESIQSECLNYPTIWLKFEPFVMHVECKDEMIAKGLLSLSSSIGFKNSGIISLDRRNVVAFRGNLRLEVPVVLKSQVVVSEDYTEKLIQVSNDKMKANLAQIDKLTNAVNRFLNPQKEVISGKILEIETISSAENIRVIGGAYSETVDYLYVFGGLGGVRVNRSSDLFILDKKRGEFQIVPDSAVKPSARAYASMAYPYMFGGRKNPNEPMNDLWKLNGNDQWEEIEHFGEWPEARFKHCMTYDGSNLIVIGGLDGNGDPLMSCWKFERSWTRLPDAPFPCVDGSCRIVDDIVYIISGNLKEISFLNISGDMGWERVVPDAEHGYPSNRTSHAVCGNSRDFYLIGGLSEEYATLQDVWKLSFDEIITWKFIGKMPKDQWRSRCSAAYDDASSMIYLVGGGGTVFTFGSVFDPPIRMRIPRADNLFVIVKEKFLIQSVRDKLRAAGIFDESRKMITKPDYWAVPVLSFAEGFHCESIDTGKIADVSSPKLQGKYEKLGDIILLSEETYDEQEKEFKSNWEKFCKQYKVRGVGRLGEQISGDVRLSGNQLLWVEPSNPTSFVKHIENGIIYYMDICKHMFASGNGTERMRMANPPKMKEHEVIVDMFCGIGYFTLPYLVKNENVTHLYACDWNASAIDCLREACKLNKIDPKRISFHVGDSSSLDERIGENIADRISLGLIPDSKLAWRAASRILKHEGGWLHVHGIASDPEIWKYETIETFKTFGLHIIESNVVKVKNYRPKVKHYVLDIFARKM